MNDTDDIHRLTGAYALDALDVDERALFERHLAACDPCRAEADSFVAATARLAGVLASRVPDELGRDILDRARTTRQVPPVTPLSGRHRRGPRMTTWIAAAASVAMLAAGTLVGEVTRLRAALVERDATVVTLETLLAAADVTMVDLDAPDASVVRVVMAPSYDDAFLLIDGMMPAPAAHTYEVWLVHDDVVVSAGVFSVDEVGHALVSLNGDMGTVTGIAITLEPEVGTDLPTGERVASVEMSA
jgi:anti-sigma-K factor RskA